MALNHDVDLALLLVAVVKELERPLGPFGLAQELRRNEALEDCPATPPPTAIRRSSARVRCAPSWFPRGAAWPVATALGGGGVAHTDVHAEAKSGVCGGDSPS